MGRQLLEDIVVTRVADLGPLDPLHSVVVDLAEETGFSTEEIVSVLEPDLRERYEREDRAA